MKFLAFSDTHASYQLHQDIIQFGRQQQVSFFVCAGDFSQMGTFATEMLTLFNNAEAPLFFVPGNHEFREKATKEWDKLPNVFNVDRRVREFSNVTVFGRGAMDWSSLFDKPGGDPDGLERLHRGLSSYPRPFIFVTHCPPAKTFTGYTGKPGDDSDGGSVMIRTFVTALQPDLVVCGHIHEPWQRRDRIAQTQLVNVAKIYMLFEIGKNGQIVEIRTT